MIRFLRLSRKLSICRQQIFNFHTLKSRELDEPAYHKQPLDPNILSILKKYETDIFYSSHIELNKKPLSYEQRTALMARLRREKEETPPTSILVEKLVENSDRNDGNETTRQQKQQNAETIEESASADYDDAARMRYEEQRLHLAKSKLKILTEMGLRRSALDYELQDYPENWMEDYDTFDESEALADTQFGTPGEHNKFSISIDNRMNIKNAAITVTTYLYRSKNTHLKSAMPWMWFIVTMCRYQFTRVFTQ